MAEQKARHVVATNRTNGHSLEGVQDIETGVVYPFFTISAEVAAAVNAGEDTLRAYVPMIGQGLYDVAEVPS